MNIEEWRRQLRVLERAEQVARARCNAALSPFAAESVYVATRAAEDAVVAHWERNPDKLNTAERAALAAVLARWWANQADPALVIELMEWGAVWPDFTAWRPGCEAPAHRQARLAARGD